jgi:AhpC/TSA antioxidant enzyme
VFIGNGTPEMADEFVRSFGVQVPVYTDPSKRTYTAVGFKHGLLSSVDPRVAVRAAEVLKEGYRQGKIMGDAFQQGGAILVTADGRVPFVHVNAFAGDEIPPDRLLAEVRRAR